MRPILPLLLCALSLTAADGIDLRTGKPVVRPQAFEVVMVDANGRDLVVSVLPDTADGSAKQKLDKLLSGKKARNADDARRIVAETIQTFQVKAVIQSAQAKPLATDQSLRGPDGQLRPDRRCEIPSPRADQPGRLVVLVAPPHPYLGEATEQQLASALGDLLDTRPILDPRREIPDLMLPHVRRAAAELGIPASALTVRWER